MNLLKAISYLKNQGGSAQMIIEESIDIDPDFLSLFMIEKLHVDSEIVFFDYDNIPPKNEFELDGVKYVELFPLSLLEDLISDFSALPEYNTDLKLAKRLLKYRINDA